MGERKSSVERQDLILVTKDTRSRWQLDGRVDWPLQNLMLKLARGYATEINESNVYLDGGDLKLFNDERRKGLISKFWLMPKRLRIPGTFRFKLHSAFISDFEATLRGARERDRTSNSAEERRDSKRK